MLVAHQELQKELEEKRNEGDLLQKELDNLTNFDRFVMKELRGERERLSQECYRFFPPEEEKKEREEKDEDREE